MLPVKHTDSSMCGFTLIELMIVVAIIGILASLALTSFMSYQCSAKQAEAKSNLAMIRTAEEAYYTESDSYSMNLQQIGFDTIGSKRYSYMVVSADSEGFTAKATGLSNDVWVIDETGVLTHSSSGCN